MQKLSLAIKNFNDRIKVMNQTGGKQLALTVEEARSLHSDIFVLLATIAELQNKSEIATPAALSLDGGGF